MISKAELKSISSLNQKKYRKKAGKFLIEGKRLIDECLKSNYNVLELYYTNEFFVSNSSFCAFANANGISSFEIIGTELVRICDTKNPQGICALVEMPQEQQDIVCFENLIVALENISDPGNLGTILRNCSWFGINTVIIDNNCADIYNSKVTRASMGAVFHLNIIEPIDFYSYLSNFKKRNYQICCADMNGENLFEAVKSMKRILVFSNEANGPSANLEKISDNKITIPKIGAVESLNVASASAIILAELTR